MLCEFQSNVESGGNDFRLLINFKILADVESEYKLWIEYDMNFYKSILIL